MGSMRLELGSSQLHASVLPATLPTHQVLAIAAKLVIAMRRATKIISWFVNNIDNMANL